MKRKLTAMLMCLVLCVSALAGCGKSNVDETTKSQAETTKGSGDNQTTEGTDAADVSEEPVKLKVWVKENLRIDWDNNAMTTWLEEQGNFDLVFETIPSADYDTKINMALTVGDVEDLPDVILGSWSNSKVWEYAQAETILPLTEYYNNPEMAVNINDAIERTGVNYLQQVVSVDGNLYGVPMFNQSYGNEYPYKMWIYKPWLDALGEDVPTTTEEFYQLLKKVSETDLNGNGKKDEIPLAGDATVSTTSYGGYFEYLMNAFVYAGGENFRLFDDDGVASAAFATEEWKDGLEYIHKLFDEGLILSESLTMDTTQFKTLLNADENTIFAFVYFAADQSVRESDYICIDTLTGPDGVNWATFNVSSAKMRLLVTANCENPEAAFRLGDLMSSKKIGISQRFGEEGVDWDYAENAADLSGYVAAVEGFDLSIVTYDDSSFWGGSDTQYSSWLQVGPYVRDYSIANGWAVEAGSASNGAVVMYQEASRHPKNCPVVLNYTDEEEEQIFDIVTSLDNYVNEFKAGVLSGNIDLDAEWDNYLKELDKIGLDTWLDVLTVAFSRMYK